MKGADLVAEVMGNQLGFLCNPSPGSHRTDIVQAVQLGSREKVLQIIISIFIFIFNLKNKIK